MFLKEIVQSNENVWRGHIIMVELYNRVTRKLVGIVLTCEGHARKERKNTVKHNFESQLCVGNNDYHTQSYNELAYY